MNRHDVASDYEPMTARTAGLAAGLGAIILAAGVIFTGRGLILVTNVLAGTGIAIAGSYTAATPGGGRLPILLAPVVLLVLGLWILVSPVVLGATGVLFWAYVVGGTLVALLAGASGYGSLQLSQQRRSVT